MKIEKVNDNQIRATLTREDLAERHIKLSELAYGSEKARSLFQELMEQAAYECGFEANDVPLMVEAVPLSSDSILLIVTKSDYPEELDTRFSQFTDDPNPDDDDFDEILSENSSSAKDIMDLFQSARAAVATAGKEVDAISEDTPSDVDITKLFRFQNMDDVIALSHAIGDQYHGSNSLYKNDTDGYLYLVVSKSSHTPAEFTSFCSIFSEFGSQANFSVGQNDYFMEHYRSVATGDALAWLSQV